MSHQPSTFEPIGAVAARVVAKASRLLAVATYAGHELTTCAEPVSVSGWEQFRRENEALGDELDVIRQTLERGGAYRIGGGADAAFTLLGVVTGARETDPPVVTVDTDHARYVLKRISTSPARYVAYVAGPFGDEPLHRDGRSMEDVLAMVNAMANHTSRTVSAVMSALYSTPRTAL